VCATDRLHARFGEPEVPDLSLLDQLLHRSRHVLDRDVRVDTVLIEEVDRLDPESLERAVGALLDVLGVTIDDLPPVGIDLDPELGGDHHLPAHGSQGLSHELLVRERTVGLGGVEEGHATFDGRPEQRDHLLLVRGRTVRVAHPHAAQARADTSRLLLPSARFFIACPLQDRGTSLSVVDRASGVRVLLTMLVA
jgi:hypothetical protein